MCGILDAGALPENILSYFLIAHSTQVQVGIEQSGAVFTCFIRRPIIFIIRSLLLSLLNPRLSPTIYGSVGGRPGRSRRQSMLNFPHMLPPFTGFWLIKTPADSDAFVSNSVWVYRIFVLPGFTLDSLLRDFQGMPPSSRPPIGGI